MVGPIGPEDIRRLLKLSPVPQDTSLCLGHTYKFLKSLNIVQSHLFSYTSVKKERRSEQKSSSFHDSMTLPVGPSEEVM